MWKEHELAILSSNEKAFIQKFGNQLRLNQFKDANLAYWMNLYILSDEEVKEGDWCLSDLATTKPFQCTNLQYVKQYNYKKIIITTDKSLKSQCNCNKYCGEPEFQCNYENNKWIEENI